MNWHDRYCQQAGWTRELRRYVLQRAGWDRARRVLEVGCGTGAVLSDLPGRQPSIHGLDHSYAALQACRLHAPAAHLTCGDACILPYSGGSFDITFCHFLLLWLPDPLQALLEMKRVTARSGYVMAFAEPDYASRHTAPSEMQPLARLQNEALQRQGAALQRGAELADLFQRAGIRILEAGVLRPYDQQPIGEADWEAEWQVLESDLSGSSAPADLARIKAMDRRAFALGKHAFIVPMHFAWGQV